MSEAIIEARGLTKTYRLYRKPHYRFLDMFGLLRGPRRYTELSALDNVDLRICRGEKVAIIGRNGAGKSTFLKLVSGVIEPSAGELVVAEKVHALLQIGTGFHPEFTGRENVYSYLAQFGITGKEADRKLREIIEFAELEEYIEQPIKTYSTGMGVRLMFSTSTAITPEVLVLDEVLGVGDAYFTQKSYERIRELCEGAGTTLLLVTHDLYAATRICTRFIWIDRGRVLLDSDAVTVVNRYEASIRDQEEQRLRKIGMKAIRENQRRGDGAGGAGADVPVYFAQIRAQGTVPLDADVPVRGISFWKGDERLASIAPGEGDEGDGITLSLRPRTGNWGDPVEVDGIRVRCFATSGSIYHRAPFVIHSREFDAALGDALAGADDAKLAVELEFRDADVTPLIVDVFNADEARCLRADFDNDGSGEWVKSRIELVATSRIEAVKPRFNRYGSQMLSITNVLFLDAEEKERLCFEVGERMTIRLRYRINDPTFREKAIIQVNFLQNGVVRSHRFTLDDELFDYDEADHGVLEIEADPLLLGPGEYLVNVAAMREGGYSRDADAKFFTANESLLDHHSRAYHLVVRPSENRLANDVMFLHPATWRRNGRVVFRGTYPLPDHAPAPAGAGVPAGVARLRRAMLDLVRAVAAADDPAPPPPPPPPAHGPGAPDGPASREAQMREAQMREAFDELTILLDAGGAPWTYGVVAADGGAPALATESGLALHDLDGAAEGVIGIAGVWGALTEADDPKGLLDTARSRLAEGGLVVASVPNAAAPGVTPHGDASAPAFDRHTLDTLLAAAGLEVVDVCAEGANDYAALLAWFRSTEPRMRALAGSILASLAEPLEIVARLAGIAPRLRVVACRAGEASRFASAVTRLGARRRQTAYEATLSPRLEAEIDETSVYVDPPSLEDADDLFRCDPAPLDAGDVVQSGAIMRLDGRRIVVQGTADAPHSYLLRTAYRDLDDDCIIVAEGVLRSGGLTIGLLRDDRWASQVSVTTKGPFRVAIQAPYADRYAIVVANCLGHGPLENDFELGRFGVARRVRAGARG